MRESPVRDRLEALGASMAAYGPPGVGIDVTEAVDAIELEYGSLRKTAALFDQPQRGVLEITGQDRSDFLQRMVTQELKGLEPWQLRRAFLLNRKGRIEADLRILALHDRTLLELDAHNTPTAVGTLSGYLFTEDVQVLDVSESRHRLALHGPRSREVLGALSEPLAGSPAPSLEADRACSVRVAGVDVVVFREDWAGQVGLELVMNSEGAPAVFDAIVSADGVRAVGWHALNVARIEAGTPIFNLDFGPSSLPAETSLLADRVSFTKGCYPGQEVVARMQSLGRPKQRIVSLAPAGQVPRDQHGQPFLPVTGAQVFEVGNAGQTPVGAVTSATLSPMLGAMPICLATVKDAFAAAGTELEVHAEGRGLVLRVEEELARWRPDQP